MKLLNVALVALALCGCEVKLKVESFPSADSASPTLSAAKLETPVAIDSGSCNASSCKAPQKILVLGDSEAGAVSPSLKNVLLPGETTELEYKSGSSIEYWARGKFHEALGHHFVPDVIIVFLGTNNYGYQTLPDVTPILDEIVQTHAKCIWVGPTSVNGQKWKIDKLLKKAVSGQCSYVDTEELDIELADGIHPTQVGVTKWLNEIWSVKGAKK